MTSQQNAPPSKRQKLQANDDNHNDNSIHKGLDRPISPPPSRRKNPAVPTPVLTPTWGFDDVPRSTAVPASPHTNVQQNTNSKRDYSDERKTKYLPSPFQLTQIRDLVDHQNVDAVGLKDILGDPMIKECWNFNFLFDLDFVMCQFDNDVRDLVSLKIIHGFWKREDNRGIRLLETAERYANIELIHAYMPDPFGTHHSKMLVLLRHDDHAQVVIHTANMISKDWCNMTQAVWSSPLLPVLPFTSAPPVTGCIHPIGSGERFKVDLLRYLEAYGKRLSNLTDQLTGYDFSSIRAAFVGSTPSRQTPASAQSSVQTSFGWLGLEQTLSTIPIEAKDNNGPLTPHIIMQVSSIATLGAAPTWLEQFQSVLGRVATQSSKSNSLMQTKPNIFTKRQTSATQKTKTPTPKFNVIFPTPDEIRTSLNGWESGGSIHMKLQSLQQQKQLEYMLPLFCHWKASPPASSQIPETQRQGEAHRGPAAPHIKTYIRFSDQFYKTIDWAMVTSANLSKQAWGDVLDKKGEVWIQSWEAGVVVWPALFAELNIVTETVMVPVFGKDLPSPKDVCDAEEELGVESGQQNVKVVVGFRMPYDLPLHPYTEGQSPWCATMQYAEPDWMGRSWDG
ncbi:tyrosyl-DNA phosphodiesterase 1, partial [Phaeosphaeriaceae sp. PMI808]